MKVKLLSESAEVPTRGTKGSAGWDLYSIEDVLIPPQMSDVVPTGIAIQIPPGKFGLLTHRSSLAFTFDATASLGVIDSDYRGEVKIKLFNHGTEGLYIKAGDRVAQLLILNLHNSCLTVVDKLSDTDRAGGFGSTGV